LDVVGCPLRDEGVKVILKNKKARFDYEIMDTFEAGIVLVGTEVKSLRAGSVTIEGSFARPRGRELFLFDTSISEYASRGYAHHDPKRPRKLLMHRHQIIRLLSKIKERGLTLVPLSIYFKGGIAKVELGLVRGKKVHDKRDAIRKRSVERDLKRQMTVRR
jgi:SsrA-binding protein